MLTAIVCAGAVTAQFVGGKATRDALFLASLNLTALPTMLIATSVCSILLVAANTRLSQKISPARLVPSLFGVSGVLFLAEWLLTYRAPKIAAVLVYLHISGAGPLLGSGFWLIASERFDPRTAKRRFGQIAGAGTLGGLLSALLAERVAAWFGIAAMLPFLAAFHFLSAWQIRELAAAAAADDDGTAPVAKKRVQAPVVPQRSGLRVLAEAPYLRNLAALVLLGTSSAALLDYLFKAEAVSAFGRGDALLRFFAIYYAATSLVTFLVQTSLSRVALERFGLGLTTSTPSWALLAGSVVGLLAPGFQSMTFARGAESAFRGSLFRAGYELFYTPIPAAEKRAAKSIIDVAFDRLGDAVGGGLVRGVLILVPVASRYSTILAFAIVFSVAAVVVARRLNRGYIQTLEKSLLNRAIEIDLSEVEDMTTRMLMLRTLSTGLSFTPRRAKEPDASRPSAAAALEAARIFGADSDLQDIAALRSRDRDRINRVLHRENGLTHVLVPHAILLLAWDPVAADAVFALRKIAEEHVGQLIDALIDPNQDFAVRRRLARVFSVCVSQRAVDGVLLGFDDLRFEVRFQCGLSLSQILDKNPRVQIDSQRILDVVLREAAVGRPVWEGRRLLDDRTSALEPESVSFVDDFVRDRAGQSLAHVFTLLSLVLPREPLQIAFRSLHTNDRQLQGTALEYLEGVLPAPIRDRLWPYLEDRRPASRVARPRAEILADLMRSNHSIFLNLEELRQRAAQAGGTDPAETALPFESGS
jgi:AAA family ATP:ADP antiporter